MNRALVESAVEAKIGAIALVPLHKLGCTQVLGQLLQSLVHNLRENRLAMVELGPVAPVRQTHLETWVGNWLQGSWALWQRAHLRLAKDEAA